MKLTQLVLAASAAMFSLGLVAAPQVGAPAPDFTVVDSKGNSHSLKDFAGKNVVLEWTNHDCPFVKKHYSGNMQALQAEMKLQDVVWLSVISSAPGKQGHVSGAKADELTASRSALPTAVVRKCRATAPASRPSTAAACGAPTPSRPRSVPALVLLTAASKTPRARAPCTPARARPPSSRRTCTTRVSWHRCLRPASGPARRRTAAGSPARRHRCPPAPRSCRSRSRCRLLSLRPAGRRRSASACTGTLS